MLPADVPELEVDGRIRRGESERDGILANGGHGLEVGVGGRVGGFDLLEERGFARVVEAEEEDRVFWASVSAGRGRDTGHGTWERRSGTFFTGGVQINGLREVVHD
jgi:hypothetical protein